MHADLSERVVVATQTASWLATADGEGACKPLDSLAAGANATSLVQASAGAMFVPPGGELGSNKGQATVSRCPGSPKLHGPGSKK